MAALKSSNGPAAVNDERSTRGERGFVAREEQRHLRDFLGLADAPERRDAVDGALGHGAAALYPRDHWSVDGARTDRVDANVVTPVLQRGDLGDRDDASLRRAVRRRIAQADEAGDRRGVDDRAAAILDHLGDGVFHSEPYAAKVDRNNAVEVLVSQLHNPLRFAFDSRV